jgi:hypothetical protein
MEPGFEVGLRLRFSLKRQDRRVASRQTPYFLSKRQQKVSKKCLSPGGGHSFLSGSEVSADGGEVNCRRAPLRGSNCFLASGFQLFT